MCIWLILSIQGTQWAVKLGSGGQRRDHVENQVHTAMQRSAGASWFRLVLTKFGDVHVVVLESRQKPALSWTQVPIQCDTTDVMLPLVETRQKSRLLTADARMQGRGRGGADVCPRRRRARSRKLSSGDRILLFCPTRWLQQSHVAAQATSCVADAK